MSLHDDELITRLRTLAHALDPPPDALRDAGRAAFTWRNVDTELAELVADSATEEAALATVRSAGGPRFLTFGCDGVEVEVQVTDEPPSRRLEGQIVPPQPGRVEVRHREGLQVVEADDLGRFAAEGVPPGPVSLRCALGDGRERRIVSTDWLSV